MRFTEIESPATDGHPLGELRPLNVTLEQFWDCSFKAEWR